MIIDKFSTLNDYDNNNNNLLHNKLSTIKL